MSTQLCYNEIAQYNILKCMIHDITVVFHMDDFILCWGSSLPSVFTCYSMLSFQQLSWVFSENNISYSFEVWPPPQFLKILVHYQFHYSGHKDGQSELFPENLFRDVRRGLYFLGGGLAIYPLLPSSPTATMEGNIQHTVGGVETSAWKHGRDTDFFLNFAGLVLI